MKTTPPQAVPRKPSLETHKRSVAKAITYRLLGTAVTATVALLVTGQIRTAAAIGVVDTVFKIFGYYVHERVWENIRFGRGKPPEYQI
jgi:uncharacterized membrane protein